MAQLKAKDAYRTWHSRFHRGDNKHKQKSEEEREIYDFYHPSRLDGDRISYNQFVLCFCLLDIHSPDHVTAITDSQTGSCVFFYILSIACELVCGLYSAVDEYSCSQNVPKVCV